MLDLTRQEFNIKILKEFNDNSAVMISDNTRLSTDGFITDKFYGQDKIHLNAVGTKILAILYLNLESLLLFFGQVDTP